MKHLFKIIALFTCLSFTGLFQAVRASYFIYPAIPEKVLGMKMSEFKKLTMHDYSLITGTKISFKERIAFMSLKKEVKKELKKTGNDQLMKDYLLNRPVDKKDKTALIIGLIILVVVIGAIIIAESINNIDIGLGS